MAESKPSVKPQYYGRLCWNCAAFKTTACQHAETATETTYYPCYQSNGIIPDGEAVPRSEKVQPIGDGYYIKAPATAYRFEIPGKLPGLNEYIHAINKNRYIGNQLKQETQTRIMWAARVGLPRRLHITKPVQMYITYIEPDKRRDFDNIQSATKFIQDALMELRVIDGDGQKYVRPPVYFHDVSKDNPRVIVEIYETEERESGRKSYNDT